MTETADLRVLAAGKTDAGRVRDHNEDCVLVAPDLGLFVVADGMGGHASGQISSAAAVASMHNFFEAMPSGTPTTGAPEDEPPRLVKAIRKANRDLFEISAKHPEHRGMGSTVVALHLEGRTATLAHVGDSRCYRLRDGAIAQLTGDHSLRAEALRARPNLDPGALAALPKNVITRALGTRESVEVDVQRLALEPGDLLLLCSDGLHGMIDDETIAAAAAVHDDLAEACDLLVALAIDAGGSDNVSVVMLGVGVQPAEAGEAVSVEATVELVDDALAQFEGVLPAEELEQLRRGELVDVSARRCGACGRRIVEGNQFCTECGGRVA